jgi:hypothetical protein
MPKNVGETRLSQPKKPQPSEKRPSAFQEWMLGGRSVREFLRGGELAYQKPEPVVTYQVPGGAKLRFEELLELLKYRVIKPKEVRKLIWGEKQ